MLQPSASTSNAIARQHPNQGLQWRSRCSRKSQLACMLRSKIQNQWCQHLPVNQQQHQAHAWSSLARVPNSMHAVSQLGWGFPNKASTTAPAQVIVTCTSNATLSSSTAARNLRECSHAVVNRECLQLVHLLCDNLQHSIRHSTTQTKITHTSEAPHKRQQHSFAAVATCSRGASASPVVPRPAASLASCPVGGGLNTTPASVAAAQFP